MLLETTEQTHERDGLPPATERPRAHLDGAEHLWIAYRATEDAAIRNELVLRYLPLVKYNAERIWSRLPEGADVNDLSSAGVFGLLDAIDAFDLDRGIKFETYCVPRIRGAILDELRTMDWVPRLVRAKASKLRTAIDDATRIFGREPTDDELAELLDTDVRAVERLKEETRAKTISSMNAVRFETDSQKDVTDESLLADARAAAPGDEEERRDFWRAMLKGLNRQERLMLILYYRENKTMKEIGEELGLSESRVSQMHGRIVHTMIPLRMLHNRSRASFVGALYRERR